MNPSVLQNGTLLKNEGTTVFKVLDEWGQVWVSKLFALQDRALVEKQGEIGRFLTYLEDRMPGFPFPLPHPDGVQEIDYGTLTGGVPDVRLWANHEWVAGKRIPFSAATHWAFAMGQVVGGLHLAAQALPFELHLPHLDQSFMAQMRERILSAPLLAAWPMRRQERVRARLLAIEAATAQIGYGPAVYGAAHTDLHWGNWLEVDGRPVPIDFDYTAYAHYGLDLAVLCNDIAHRAPYGLRAGLVNKVLLGYWAKIPWTEEQKLIFPVFTEFAHALYLNWALAPENIMLLEQSNLQKRAKKALLKLAGLAL